MPGDQPTLRSSHGQHGGDAAADAGLAPGDELGPNASAWRSAWQIPTILVSVALIVIGARSAIQPAASDDLDGALAQVADLLETGQVDAALAQMRTTIEPSIARASILQQARFHALSGDLTFVSQETEGVRSQDGQRHILHEYQAAEEMGLILSPARQERCGETLLALGEIEAVQQRLSALQEMAKASPPPAAPAEEPLDHPENAYPAAHPPPLSDADAHAARDAHGRLFRRMVDVLLLKPEIDSTRVMEMLAAYRLSAGTSERDRLWAAARLAQLRIETGDAEAAIDGLLVEMRRLESHAPNQGVPPGFGELYLLLGRGYFDRGETEQARRHLEIAQGMLDQSEPARGDALVLLGRMSLSSGDYDVALERFNAVVEEFIATTSHLPALLGRAEVQSILGDHIAAQADFREVAAMLKRVPARRDVSRQIVSERLCDRHDAALAMERLERALEYAQIAESLYESDAAPPPVLFRLASTNRQIAENLLTSASTGGDTPTEDLDPAVRYEANQRLTKAGEDYLRHVNAESQQPLSEEDWGASLWAAADCFDHAGQHRRAIAEFERYLGSRAADDARRAEGMFRIAQAHHALLQHAEAARWYEQVLADRTRSSFAARCHVPLARCYLALKRTDDAKAALQAVLSGERLLQPDALDYRDALIELGQIHHDLGEHVQAIERLAEAIARYPDDARLLEARYLLADSYRGTALDLAKRLHDEAGLGAAESGRLSALRIEHLQKAEQMFGAVCADADAPNERISASDVVDLVRRAHLYQADCAFELGRFDHAVELYESASRTYSAGASSMYALVQIVNCYAALGDSERSSAAHQRALLRLKQLPDSAFAAPEALMDRAAWERWLRNSPAGATVTASAGAEAG